MDFIFILQIFLQLFFVFFENIFFNSNIQAIKKVYLKQKKVGAQKFQFPRSPIHPFPRSPVPATLIPATPITSALRGLKTNT
jgi:hypothetical protein